MTTLPPDIEKWAEGEAQKYADRIGNTLETADARYRSFLAGAHAMWGKVEAEITRLKGEVEGYQHRFGSTYAHQLEKDNDSLRAEVEKLKHWRSIFMEWEKLLDPYAEKVHADLVRDLLRDRKRERAASKVLEDVLVKLKTHAYFCYCHHFKSDPEIKAEMKRTLLDETEKSLNIAKELREGRYHSKSEMRRIEAQKEDRGEYDIADESGPFTREMLEIQALKLENERLRATLREIADNKEMCSYCGECAACGGGAVQVAKERDALKLENERLRGALKEIVTTPLSMPVDMKAREHGEWNWLVIAKEALGE